ncbi:MAG: hypothetical protein LBT46_04805 [Planctomycetaceae bacterium]|jgi:hypothetical protein|nr:hypothetical protein [Planctomycetaceae bacterium]
MTALIASLTTSAAAYTALKTTDAAVKSVSTDTEPTGDIVTISAEGLEAYNKLENVQVVSAEKLGLIEKFEEQIKAAERRFDTWFGTTIPSYDTRVVNNCSEERRDKLTELEQYRAEHSRHLDINAWAGISTNSFTFDQFWQISNGNQKTAAVYSQAQSSLELVDKKIADVLKSNGIILTDKETLNFSVNQDGKIIIGEGVGESKRETIEKLLNADTSLSRDLINTYGFRAMMEKRQDSPASPSDIAQAVLRQDIDAVLQREYGVCLGDFELNPERYDELSGFTGEPYIRNKDGSTSLTETLRGEEFALYESMYMLLSKENRVTQGVEKNDDFTLSFAYKNGITVQKGLSDQAALDNVPEELSSLLRIPGSTSAYSVTINSSGTIINSNGDAQDIMKPMMSIHLDSLDGELSYQRRLFSRANFDKQFLQQYVVDMQRLTKFNTGAEAEWGQITFGKAGGTAFSVAVK